MGITTRENGWRKIDNRGFILDSIPRMERKWIRNIFIKEEEEEGEEGWMRAKIGANKGRLDCSNYAHSRPGACQQL